MWIEIECETRYTTEFVTILNKCDCWKSTLQLDKTRLICETFEYVWVVEGDMNVKLDIQLNLWQYWISATVERDENVKRDQTIEFVTLLNLWNYEWDMSVKLEKTSEFANCRINGTIDKTRSVNMWDCLMRLDFAIG